MSVIQPGRFVSLGLICEANLRNVCNGKFAESNFQIPFLILFLCCDTEENGFTTGIFSISSFMCDIEEIVLFSYCDIEFILL